jgi:hypothetical protein
MRRVLLASALVFSLAWGCDSGPAGPGSFLGTVQSEGPPLGGAVLEVVGKGIEGFSGVGDTRVFWAPQAAANTYRVVVIAPTPGDPQFQVSVQNLGAGRPKAALLGLVGGDNRTLPVTNDYRVRLRR